MPDPEESEWGKSADYVLELLARLANQVGRVNETVTLYLPGVTVCGKVVGGSEWHRSHARISESAAIQRGDDPTLLAMSAMQETLAEDEQQLARALPPFPEGSPPNTIHIEVTAMWVGSVKWGSRTPFVWRGRLSQVLGWHYGVVSQLGG